MICKGEKWEKCTLFISGGDIIAASKIVKVINEMLSY
jgi:hypothetical protein